MEVGVPVAVPVLVDRNVAVGLEYWTPEVGVFVDCFVARVAVEAGGWEVGYEYEVVDAGKTRRVGVANVILTVGGIEAGFARVPVGARVEVAGNRWFAVIVGTGESRATCKVAIRSCGAPVAGRSQMICLRMFSSMGGIDEGRTSAP